MTIFNDALRCKKCGGKCCLIYLPFEKGGMYFGQYGFRDWCEGFHEDSDEYGVEPLFDPIQVHKIGNEWMRADLLVKGINPDACQYMGPAGCLIPWEKRPIHCTDYRCYDWLNQSTDDR